MTSPLTEEPRRWDDLLAEAKVHAPRVSLVKELADALEQDRDRADSAQGYSKHQEDELTEARQEIERLRDKLHEAEIERDALTALCGKLEAVEPSPDLRERVEKAIVSALGLQAAIDAVLPVIATEVSARVSEAQVAVLEPLCVGQVLRVEKDVLSGFDHVTVLTAGNVQDVADGEEVGIWPADLAEQVAEAQQDELGLQDELDAMTAVAKRLKDGYEPDKDGHYWWLPATSSIMNSADVTDAERRALQVLSEGETDHG